MASGASNDQEDIIKCSICFEIFNHPKYLPCLHTFCETCLGTYITSSLTTISDRGSEKGFSCPICRTTVQIPKDGAPPPKELAKTFPNNHLIMTLIDQSKLRSTEKHCDPCKITGENTKAITWCTDCNEALCNHCDKIHRAMKATKNHNIITIDNFKESSIFITTLDECDDHKNKKLEFYCVDHETPCCSTCVTVNHRKCEHVKTLEQAAQGSRENSVITDLSKSFNEMSSILESIINKKDTNLKDIETVKVNLQDNISRFRLDVNKYLDDLEAILSEQLNSMHKECKHEIEDEKAELENTKKIADNCRSVADACLKSASDIHIFLEVNKLRKRHQQQVKYLTAKLKTLKYFCYELEIEKELSDLKARIKSLGKVVKTTKEIKLESLHAKYEFATSGRLRDCAVKECITFNPDGAGVLSSGIFLPEGRMLLSDYSNKRMLVCDCTGHCHKEICLQGMPWDVTLIDTFEAAVVLTDIQTIQFIDIVNLTTGRKIKLDGLYSGIAYNGRHVIVGCKDCIAVVEKSGHIVRSMKLNSYLQCIAVHGDNILCPSWSDQTLQCFNTSGNLLFTYSNNELSGPYGVAFDNDGNIYVSGYHSHNIHQLDNEGKLIKIILSPDALNQRNPRGINFDSNFNRFLVIFNTTVKIFELVDT